MTTYICKGCHRPACIEDHPANDFSPAYQEITCLTPSCLLLGVVTDSRDEMGIANRFIMPTPPPMLKPSFNPAAPMQRVSERSDFIPLKTGDPIPDELRTQLNVGALIDELRRAT